MAFAATAYMATKSKSLAQPAELRDESMKAEDQGGLQRLFTTVPNEEYALAYIDTELNHEEMLPLVSELVLGEMQRLTNHSKGNKKHILEEYLDVVDQRLEQGTAVPKPSKFRAKEEKRVLSCYERKEGMMENVLLSRRNLYIPQYLESHGIVEDKKRICLAHENQRNQVVDLEAALDSTPKYLGLENEFLTRIWSKLEQGAKRLEDELNMINKKRKAEHQEFGKKLAELQQRRKALERKNLALRSECEKLEQQTSEE